jgi:hypothetical protein
VYGVAVLLATAAVIAGLALVFTVGSLLGYLVIIGGVAGLGWAMVPAAIDRVVRWLSSGR